MNTYFANKCISLHLYLTPPLLSPPSLPSTSCLILFWTTGVEENILKVPVQLNSVLSKADLVGE